MTVTVNTPSKVYDVTVAAGAFDSSLTKAICERAPGAAISVISDETVWSLYGAGLSDLLINAKTRFCSFIIKPGETSKNPENLFAFLEFMAEHGFTRGDAVLALGGGVVGDLGGLAASLFQRGMKLFQVPTSLLAMVDSSVGGKTAVDIAAGKNLVGSFYQPDAVICDTDFTKTLPHEIFRDGCAEIIKYGIALDGVMFEKLRHGIHDDNTLEYAVLRSVELKRDIVALDERDNGPRAVLNLGHTFAHAIEKLSGYKISHGSAVARGTLLAAKAAAALGIGDVIDETEGCLAEYGFDLCCPFSATQMADAALSDKKLRGGFLTLVLPERIGSCVCMPFAVDGLNGLFGRIIP